MPQDRDLQLPGSLSFEGHAIVSADGMIANGDGSRPAQLDSDADWRLFQAALDSSVLVVLGRIAHERHLNPGRRRLVLTKSVAAVAPDPADRMATFWNPAGMSLAIALTELGIAAGTVAVTGVFDSFASELDHFTLVEVGGFVLPGGMPCFDSGHPRVVLARNGLLPGESREIDRGVTLTSWAR